MVEYSYDSWGKLLDVTGDTVLGNANPFRYRSYYYDSETGFYYLGGRYYDAQVGRFINADNAELLLATPASLTDKNLYAYCDNNPVMRKDEGGEFWGVVIVGALVGLTTSFIASKVTGQEFTPTDALVAAGTGALGAAGAGLISGIISGSYVAYKSYESGSSWGTALVDGVMSGLSNQISVNNLAELGGVNLDIITSVATDVTFGLGYSCVLAATNKSREYITKPKNEYNSRRNKNASTDSYDTFILNKKKEQIKERRRLV